MAVARCNVCVKNGREDPFRVPWDEAGVALMQAHLESDHPTEVKEGRCQPSSRPADQSGRP